MADKKINESRLSKLSGKKIITPQTINDFPKGYMVYVLSYKQKAIVVGYGKKNRAQVILDNLEKITGHNKQLVVRGYWLFGNGEKNFARYLIPCKNKEEAITVEKELHGVIGGNTTDILKNVKKKFLNTLNGKSRLFLELALCSNYGGIALLTRWYDNKLINKETWRKISNHLQLPN